MNQPEKNFQHGTCRASIFVNKVSIKGKEVDIKKVTMSKRYKDRDGQWKNSSSLDVNDVPKMIAALMSAYVYLTQSNVSNGLNDVWGVEEETIQ